MEASQNIDSWPNSIFTFWKSKGIAFNDTDATEESLLEAEKAIHFEFPVSFRQFYKIANGFEAYDWTENMISIWCIERIVEEYPFRNHTNFVAFADFLIGSHTYGFKKDEPGVFKCYDTPDTPFIKIAENFMEAMDLINQNADLLY